jgi:hypothetical protein
MLQTVEAEIDVNGQVHLLEPITVPHRSRAIVTVLRETDGVSQPKGNAARALQFLRENRLPVTARPSVAEMEEQITEARESWD